MSFIEMTKSIYIGRMLRLMSLCEFQDGRESRGISIAMYVGNLGNLLFKEVIKYSLTAVSSELSRNPNIPSEENVKVFQNVIVIQSGAGYFPRSRNAPIKPSDRRVSWSLLQRQSFNFNSIIKIPARTHHRVGELFQIRPVGGRYCIHCLNISLGNIGRRWHRSQTVQIKLMKLVLIHVLLVSTSASLAMVLKLRMDKNRVASIAREHALCSVHAQRIHHELKVAQKIYIFCC